MKSHLTAVAVLDAEDMGGRWGSARTAFGRVPPAHTTIFLKEERFGVEIASF